MNNDNKEPGSKRVDNTSADNSKASAYDNTIEVGSVGIEGDGNNGASTLRILRKKHANDLPAKKANAKRHIL